ncbi:unnamed protein product [Trifolium pratense]|uniref:Uncharacterized protein n=1 Tax=Trifolium pratense TaxID=57577 RepID=A0ACB0MDM1_TRIPR|nr:unnamed protein product [Trifolium pratense]
MVWIHKRRKWMILGLRNNAVRLLNQDQGAMGKGMGSFRTRRNKTHMLCVTCGCRSFHLQKSPYPSCAYQDNWNEKLLGCLADSRVDIEKNQGAMQFLDSHDPYLPLIIILQLCKLKKFLGSMGISNSFYGSESFLNAEIPAAASYIER